MTLLLAAAHTLVRLALRRAERTDDQGAHMVLDQVECDLDILRRRRRG